MRTCNRCDIEKNIDQFNFRKDSNIYRRECKTCQNNWHLKKYYENPEKYKNKNKLRYEKHKEKILIAQKLYYHKTIDKQKEYRKIYQRTKNGKDSHNASCKKYRQSNKKLICFYSVNRQEKIKKNTPKWVDKKEIKLVYLNCPQNMSVDHILPITNENISGLHVPWNLQYLTMPENSTKNNKFDFTYDNKGWKKCE